MNGDHMLVQPQKQGEHSDCNVKTMLAVASVQGDVSHLLPLPCKGTLVKSMVLESILTNLACLELNTVPGRWYYFWLKLKLSSSAFVVHDRTLQSARLHKEILKSKWGKEMKATRIAVYSLKPLSKNLVCSTFGGPSALRKNQAHLVSSAIILMGSQ